MVEEKRVPEGYKMTEVGVIPEDWEVVEVDQVLKVRHGKSQHEVVNENGVYPILATGGQIGWSTCYLYDKPSVLIGRKGTIDKPQYIEKPFWTIDTLFYTEISLNVVPRYIYYLFNIIDWYSYNEASGVPSLSASTIGKIKISIPPLLEQQAIAEVLTDVDNLISSLEKLIDKKEKIKQGAMQELLTGKRRLPGFDGEWEVKRIGEIADVVTGSTPPTRDLKNYGDEYFFVSPADLGKSKYIGDTEKKLSLKGFNIAKKFPKGSILFTCIGSTIGKCGIAPIGLTSNQQINAVLPNNKYSTDFVFYLLRHQSIEIKLSASEQAVPIINKSSFESIQLIIPKDIKEQQAIAQILSDMDAEIESLNQKLQKYKFIKQGMMQELLTGRVRLV